MKKIALYILLFLYVAVQLKPLTAIVEDVLAHTFFKMQHMATIHYENGKYHLHTELDAIAKEEGDLTKNKIPSTEKIIEQTANEFALKLNYDHFIKIQRVSKSKTSAGDITSGFLQINSPPPKTA